MAPFEAGDGAGGGGGVSVAAGEFAKEAGMGYIPEDRQDVGLVLDFDLAQNLTLRDYFQEPYCKTGVLDRTAFDAHGEKLIADYDIRSGQGTATQVRSMSGGNQQKAIIAREIDKDPKLLVAVQPTRGLDVGATEYVRKRLLEERERGTAIVLLSEDLDEVLALSDRIAVIYEGSIRGIIPSAEATPEKLGLMMAGVPQDEALAASKGATA